MSASAPAALDLDALEQALYVLLTPLDHDGLHGWADGVTAVLCRTLAADAGTFVLPTARAGPPRTTTDLATTGPAAAARVVGRDPRALTRPIPAAGAHDYVGDRMLALGMSAAHIWQLWAPEELGRDAAYHELIVPARLHDGLGIRLTEGVGRGAGFCVHRERPRDTAVPEDHVTFLRLLTPAFRAGLETWVGFDARRTELARVFDTQPEPVLLYSLAGERIAANAAYAALGPDTAAVEGAAQALAWSVAALARRATRTPVTGAALHAAQAAAPRATRTVRGAARTLALAASVVPEGVLDRAPAVMVRVTEAAARPLTDADLRSRYGLTPREVEVARLLADGLSNDELAHRLGVAWHTARNHVERALAKLALPSRARVGPLLRNEAGTA